MTDAAPRSTEQRKADTLAKLTAPAADVWVATAAAQAGGHASSHLVPLSLAWVDERVVLATEADSVTARNITSERHARLGLGTTRDVVRSRGHGGGSGIGRSIRMYVRASASPRRSLFELAGDPDEHVLPAVGGDQLHADRQASGGPVQRQADGRLAGHVELRGVRDEADDPPAFVLRPGGGEPPSSGGGAPRVGVRSRSYSVHQWAIWRAHIPSQARLCRYVTALRARPIAGRRRCAARSRRSSIGRPSSVSNSWNVVSVSAAMIVLKCLANSSSNMRRRRGLRHMVTE